MIDSKQLDRLHENEDFVGFMEEVFAIRESLLQQMHDRPEGALQQISGRILQCDDILAIGGWNELVKSGRAEAHLPDKEGAIGRLLRKFAS